MVWVRRLVIALVIFLLAVPLIYMFIGQLRPDYRQIKSYDRSSTAPLVTIRQGELQGIWADRHGTALFAGIPYAAPPTGERRFSPPQKHTGWSGLRKAGRFGEQCIQQTSDNGTLLKRIITGQGFHPLAQPFIIRALTSGPEEVQSEDCLFLNIRSSDLSKDAAQPVMVWIHGGGHHFGHGGVGFYQSNEMARKAVVQVTINYRLGLMGYFSHPALSAQSENGVSGNYGLLDQIAALQWVQENIAEFGGDPGNVTVYGESAGGQSISELMASPLAKGLFHKAILQSGVYGYHHSWINKKIDNRKPQQEYGAEFVKKSGLISGEITAKKLRELEAEQLLAAQREIDLPVNDWLMPAADGYVLPKTVLQSLIDGDLTDIPLIAGFNKDEGTIFSGRSTKERVFGRQTHFPETVDEAKIALEQKFGKEIAAQIIEYYGPLRDENLEKFEIDFFGDLIFGVYTRMLLQKASGDASPAYGYFFTRESPSKRQTLGAFHAAEIAFVHGTYGLMPHNGGDKKLSAAMLEYWTQFAKTGDPNAKGLLSWPAYDVAEDQWMELNREQNIIYDLRREKLDCLEVWARGRAAASR